MPPTRHVYVCVCERERERERVYTYHARLMLVPPRGVVTPAAGVSAPDCYTHSTCVCVFACVFVRAFNVWCSPHAKTVDGACVRDAWQGICTLQQCVCVHRYVDMHAAHTHTQKRDMEMPYSSHTHTSRLCVRVCVCTHTTKQHGYAYRSHTHTRFSCV